MADSSFNGRQLPNNYIYISHLRGELSRLNPGTVIKNGGSPVKDTEEAITEPYFIIPTYPDSIADSLGSTFQQTNALGRSAPVWTYSNSGPRSVQFSFKFHRDMMDEYNVGVSNYIPKDGEDYVDGLIHALQAIAVPKYNLSNKLVEPPLVAVRISEDIFVKGIVTNGVTVNYEKPLLMPNGRYAVANVQFTVSEIDPYGSTTVFQNGSFRGMVKTMKAGFNMETNGN